MLSQAVWLLGLPALLRLVGLVGLLGSLGLLGLLKLLELFGSLALLALFRRIDTTLALTDIRMQKFNRRDMQAEGRRSGMYMSI